MQALGALAKKGAFPSLTIDERYRRLSSPYFGEITREMPFLRHPGMTLAFFARLLRNPRNRKGVCQIWKGGDAL